MGRTNKEQDKERKQIMADAIACYGAEKQVGKAVEELAELQVELARALQGDVKKENIITEIADVRIMLSQLCMIYKIDSEVSQEVEYKLKRLEGRLDERFPVKQNKNAYPGFCERSATCKNYCPCICGEQCEYERNDREK